VSAAREQSEVQFGRTRISYDIRRSSRRSTVAVTVSPPGVVVLTAPQSTPVERLDRVVHEKARWIVSRLRLVRPGEPTLPTREFVTGETFLYLGRQYRLMVRSGSPAVRLEHGRFVVTSPRAVEHDRRAEIRDLLLQWYRRHAVERVQDLVSRWAPRLGVDSPKVLVREQERRWGSCGAGVVRFNWRVIQAPMRLVEYVVVHELAHLLHDDHGRAFWAALGQSLPDYEQRREALRQAGPRLQW
jgi:predicted metal-dependent hydrolase